MKKVLVSKYFVYTCLIYAVVWLKDIFIGINTRAKQALLGNSFFMKKE